MRGLRWTMARHILLAFMLLGSAASQAVAQTEGRISVGVSTTINVTPDGGVGTGKGIGVLVRLNPKPGWGPAGALIGSRRTCGGRRRHPAISRGSGSGRSWAASATARCAGLC